MCARPIQLSNKFASGAYIEISGRCNAKCPYCARQRFKQRYSGKYMSPALFEQILDHLLNVGVLSRIYTPVAHLYNWGEPFLNPEINDILKIVGKKKLRVGISSNFLVKPKLDNNNLSVIYYITLSLSGFTQESYGKIHGVSLDRILDNFEDFYEKICNYAPSTRINISWHRYTFNEVELWEAYKYFNRPRIHFSPVTAYLNDLPEMLSCVDGGLSEDRQKQAEKDLFLGRILQSLVYHKQKSKHYYCPQWKQLVIDETGQLLLCCGMSNEDTNHVFGNVLEMSAEEIWQKKMSDPICKTCVLSGLSRAINSREITTGNKHLPPGGKGNYVKLLYQLYLTDILDCVAKTVRVLPGGEQIIQSHTILNMAHLLRSGK